MPVGEELRTLAWDSMLTADLNQRYWGYLTRRFASQDKWVKIFVALFSSGTAVASWSVWNRYPLPWQCVSGAAAVLAVVSPFLKFSEDSTKAAEIRGKWARVLNLYEQLWATVDTDPEDSIRRQLSQVKESEAEVSAQETGLPNDRALALRCYDEVIALRVPESQLKEGEKT